MTHLQSAWPGRGRVLPWNEPARGNRSRRDEPPPGNRARRRRRERAHWPLLLLGLWALLLHKMANRPHLTGQTPRAYRPAAPTTPPRRWRPTRALGSQEWKLRVRRRVRRPARSARRPPGNAIARQLRQTIAHLFQKECDKEKSRRALHLVRAAEQIAVCLHRSLESAPPDRHKRFPSERNL